MATGTSGAKNIAQAKLKSLPIVVPPLDLQRLYTKLIKTARSVVFVADSGSRTTWELRTALMAGVLETSA